MSVSVCLLAYESEEKCFYRKKNKKCDSLLENLLIFAPLKQETRENYKQMTMYYQNMNPTMRMWTMMTTSTMMTPRG